jgi:hypothetical protein
MIVGFNNPDSSKQLKLSEGGCSEFPWIYHFNLFPPYGLLYYYLDQNYCEESVKKQINPYFGWGIYWALMQYPYQMGSRAV